MPARAPRPEPVQKFRPTNGTIVGHAGLVMAAVIAVYDLVVDPSLRSVQVALALGIAALVIWVAMLRPRAAAYQETLVLRNMLSDTHVPLAKIDAVVVRQTLNVWVGDQRHVCVGIGQTTHSMMKRRSRGPMAVVGLEQTDDRMGNLEVGEVGTSGPYHQFVQARIEDLARSARRDGRGLTLQVRREWARPELIAFGVLALALLTTLLV